MPLSWIHACGVGICFAKGTAMQTTEYSMKPSNGDPRPQALKQMLNCCTISLAPSHALREIKKISCITFFLTECSDTHKSCLTVHYRVKTDAVLEESDIALPLKPVTICIFISSRGFFACLLHSAIKYNEPGLISRHCKESIFSWDPLNTFQYAIPKSRSRTCATQQTTLLVTRDLDFCLFNYSIFTASFI